MPTWYLTNTLLSQFQELTETGPGAEATTNPQTGWQPGNASATGNPRSPFNSATIQAQATFSGTTHPNATLDSTTGDAWRTTNPYTGSFASANWVVTARLIGNAGLGQTGRLVVRLLRSTNADGSGATEVGTGPFVAGANTTVSTSGIDNAVTFNPGAFSLNNEYLFVEVAWAIYVAGSMNTAQVLLRTGTTTGTRVVSSTFTPAPVYDQEAFQARNDDGTETTATAKAAVNTNWDQLLDQNFRLRFGIQNSSAAPVQNTAFQLQYNLNGAGWNNVTGASSVARSTASPNVTDGQATTEQLAMPGTFNAGTIDEVDGSAVGYTAAPALGHETEVVYSLQLRSADVAAGNTVQFRLTQGGNPLATYTNTPTATARVQQNATARLAMDNPSANLQTGAGLQEVRIRASKSGTGTDPTLTAQIVEAGSGTVLATPINAVAVTTAGQVLSGTWNASVLAAISGANVEIVITALGPSNGLTSIDPDSVRVEWNAELQQAALVTLTGVASDETVGTITSAAGVATLTLTGVASDETVGAMSSAAGVATVTLTGVASDETVGTMTATATVGVTLIGVASDETVGIVTAAPGVRTLTLTGVASDETVGTMSPAPGVRTLTLTGVASDETVGTMTSAAGVATVTLTGVASDETVGTITPTPGVRTVTLTGVASDELVGTITPSTAGMTTLSGVASDELVGALTALPGGPITLARTDILLSRTDIFLSDTGGAALATLTGVASDELVGTLSVSSAVQVSLTGVTSDELVGTLSVSGAGQVTLTGVASDETVGALTAAAGVRTVTLTGVASDELVGTMSAAVAGSQVTLTGVGSDELIGGLIAIPGTRIVTLTGLTSEELVGLMTVIGPPQAATLIGLSSDELVGTLSAFFVGEFVGRPTITLSNENTKIRFTITRRVKPAFILANGAKPSATVSRGSKPVVEVTSRQKPSILLNP